MNEWEHSPKYEFLLDLLIEVGFFDFQQHHTERRFIFDLDRWLNRQCENQN